MGKKIIIATMLVLTLLLLMPSIPAIQQRTIENGIKQDLQEKLESINFDDLKDIKVLDDMKRPLLYAFYLFLVNIKLQRIFRLMDMSMESDYWGITITHPLIFVYMCWIWTKAILFVQFWAYVSYTFEWNWDFPY